MKCILYTTKEGGYFKYIKGDIDEQTVAFYKKLIKDGTIALKTGDKEPKPQKLAYVVLLEELDNFDFIINKKR